AGAMSQMLEILGHTVTVANGARTAIHAAESGAFDLLSSDIGLPDGSGLDVVRVFAERQAAPSIAITGYGMEDDIGRRGAEGSIRWFVHPTCISR
ncbi:response regulator, partial [Mycobacterium tuberculosis]|nr:response regulator [Mycobacterium tuberculosis]